MIRREGERILVEGALTVANARAAREAGVVALDRDGLVFDLAGVTEADSSALSLVFEWQRAAKARAFSVRFANLPASMRSLAQVYGVQDLIPSA